MALLISFFSFDGDAASLRFKSILANCAEDQVETLLRESSQSMLANEGLAALANKFDIDPMVIEQPENDCSRLEDLVLLHCLPFISEICTCGLGEVSPLVRTLSSEGMHVDHIESLVFGEWDLRPIIGVPGRPISVYSVRWKSCELVSRTVTELDEVGGGLDRSHERDVSRALRRLKQILERCAAERRGVMVITDRNAIEILQK
jgi:hypothetical protein